MSFLVLRAGNRPLHVPRCISFPGRDQLGRPTSLNCLLKKGGRSSSIGTKLRVAGYSASDPGLSGDNGPTDPEFSPTSNVASPIRELLATTG